MHSVIERGLSIKVLTTEDLDQIIPMEKEVRREENYNPALTQFLHLGLLRGLFLKKKLVGFISYGPINLFLTGIERGYNHPTTGEEYYLEDIYILKEYRNYELGTYLMDHTVKVLNKVVLTEAVKSTHQRFLQKAGFSSIRGNLMRLDVVELMKEA